MDKVCGAVLGEELYHALAHHASEPVDLADFFNICLPDGFQCAEVLSQQCSGLVADVADAEAEQQLVKIVLLGIFDGVEKIRCALLLELFQRQQLLERQIIKVCRRVDEVLFHQLCRYGSSQAVDVHRIAGGKMDDVAQRLGRTFRVDTAQGSFILEMDDRCAAGRAGCRHPVRLRVLRVMDDADDLRDDVAGFPHLNGIADAEAELADEILVVEGRAGHRRTGEEDRVEAGGRGQYACAAHSNLDAAQGRLLDFGRILERDGPAGELVGRAHQVALSEVIDLDDRTIHVEIEL